MPPAFNTGDLAFQTSLSLQLKLGNKQLNNKDMMPSRKWPMSVDSSTIAGASSEDIWFVEMLVENDTALQTKHEVSMMDDPLKVT